MVASFTRTPSTPAKSPLPVRKRCKGMSPAQRWAFFSPSGEGRDEYSADVCDEHLTRLAENHSRASSEVCSGSWLDCIWNGALYPPGGPCGTAMVLGVVRIGTGYAMPQSPRWTPPQNVGEEDYIDGLDRKEAAFRALSWPASPSARAIQMHAFYARGPMVRLADDRGRIGRGRAVMGAKGKNA